MCEFCTHTHSVYNIMETLNWQICPAIYAFSTLITEVL